MLKRTYPLLLLALLLAISGCGDNNGTGPTEEEPPPLPEVQNAQPDISFFEQSAPTSGDTSYTQAQLQITNANLLLSIGQVYSSFIETARDEGATFEDGTWNWNYTDTYQGISMEVDLTAQEQDNSTEWAMFWTFDDGQGNSYEDYRIMEGVVRNDGNEGEWTFNALNESGEEAPAYTSSWRIISDTEETITIEVYEENSTAVTIDYEKNAPEHTMTYNFSGEQEDVVIFWNAENGNGYLMQGDTQQCWDENLQDTACS